MNSGTTTERLYEGLKQAIQRRCLRPGTRLDPALLAPDLGSSVTPVRDALHILVGEGLVESRHGVGFYMPNLDAPCLSDLYAWNLDVLMLASQNWDATHPRQVPAGRDAVADQTADLFLAIARRSKNAIHAREVSQLNARLHPMRLAEASLFTDIEGELSPIVAALADGQPGPLRGLLGLYHRRRIKAAAELVRRTYRANDDPAEK